jgi:aryl sulfotransferase
VTDVAGRSAATDVPSESMGVRAPSRNWVTVINDSRMWDGFQRRPDDIVIGTPAKSGTTWMQGIVAAILWPAGDAPGAPFELGVWIDRRRSPDQDVRADLAAQHHRRFIKTHVPADAIPFDDACSYITVHRDPRDVTISWANHRATWRADLVAQLDELAAGEPGVTPLDPEWDGDIDRLIDELVAEFDLGAVLNTWWALRDRPNILFVHFNDLLRDLEGECRRIASFLGQRVSEQEWPGVVERCTIDEMRTVGRRSAGLDFVFEGGADSFFNRGTNGRWRGVLTDAHLDRLASLTTSLPPDAAEWLELGSLALGWRP